MKKFCILIMLMVSLWFVVHAEAANTAVITGNRIVITGDAIADDGDFDVWTALGWTPGTEKVTIDYWCWYGADIAIADVCEIETADGKPIGAPMICNVAAQTLCHPSVGATIDRIYVDQLGHGSIIIIIKQVGTPK